MGAVAALALSAVAGQASAQVTTEFTYQGRLDQSGNPSNGAFDFQFRCFDASAGGAQLGATLTFNDISVVNGLFTVTLDFGALPDDELWIEVRVRPGASGGAYTLLTPRQKKTAAPFSLLATDLRLPFAKQVGSGETLINVSNGGSGRAARFDKTSQNSGLHAVRIESSENGTAVLGVYAEDPLGRSIWAQSESGVVLIGGPDFSITADSLISSGNGDGTALLAPGTGLGDNVGAALSLFDGNAVERAEYLITSNNGAQLTGRHANGNRAYWLEEDGSAGGGGNMRIYRNDDNAVGFDVNGNNGAENTVVAIQGEVSSMSFNTGASGNSSVSFPVEAISSGEMLDEPGVGSAQSDTLVSLTSTTNAIIDTVSVNCPTNGFVVVVASVQLGYSHVAGTTSQYTIGISNNGTVLPTNQDYAVVTPSSAASGSFTQASTIHGVFPVTPGNRTFNLVGAKNLSASPTGSVFDRALTAIFVPTSYGTVEPALMVPPGGFDGGTDERVAQPFNPGLSAAQVQAKAAASLAADNARLQRELEENRRRMEALAASLEEVREEVKQISRLPADRPSAGEAPGAE
jgi:hypothetical protein